jgi:hypothetical protein
MKKLLFTLLILFYTHLLGQTNLEFYLVKANENSALLKELQNNIFINNLQYNLDYTQNSSFQIYLSGNYLFAPFFNNKSGIISTNPDRKAIGYDVGITNGGLFSAQLNIEKNIFNYELLNKLKSQQDIQEQSINNSIILLKREITKQVTEQYLTTYLSFQFYRIAKEISGYIKEQTKIIAELSKKGIVQQSAYLLISIENENQQVIINNYHSDYKSNLLQLNNLCNISDTSEKILDPLKLKTSEAVQQSDYLKKFELDILDLSKKQQIYDTKYLPQVSVFFNTGLNALEFDNIQRKFGFSAGINISIPIYDGNQSELIKDQNQIEIENVNNYKNNLGIMIKNQQLNSLQKLDYINDNISNMNRQIEYYETVMKISEAELHKGQLSITEYLTILKNYVELKKEGVISEINYQTEVNNYNYWNY